MTRARHIAVVDYGMGNRRSVEKALLHVGVDARVTRDLDELRAAAGLIVPGVGAFPRAMDNLRELGLVDVLHELHAGGTPILGICLGMQLAFASSTEHGGAQGLGFVPGEVTRLDSAGLKLPHIGWNLVTLRQGASPLTEGLPTRAAFYHVHTYAARPASDDDVLGTAEYGTPFVTAVARGSFHGVQFHPEKSSLDGLRLLANFARLCGARMTLEPTEPTAGAAAAGR